MVLLIREYGTADSNMLICGELPDFKTHNAYIQFMKHETVSNNKAEVGFGGKKPPGIGGLRKSKSWMILTCASMVSYLISKHTMLTYNL